MFRKLLLFLFLCIPVALIAAAMAFTLWGDQFLLTELRKHSHRLAPWRIEVGGLRTKLLAQFEITLDDVSLTHEKTTIRVRQAKLSSLLSGLSLYRTFREGKELPLTMSLSGPKVQMLAPGTSQPTPPAPWPKEIPFPATSPIPVAASLVVSSGEVSGAYKLKDISTKLNVRLYPAGAEMSGTVNLLAGASDGAAFVPISLNVKAAGTPQNLNLQQFQFHAVGLEGSASGQLKLKPVQGEFRVNLNASDLSRLNLRTEDRAAFGLQDQPTGSLAVNFDAVATAEGEIHGTGALQLNQVELPLRAPAHTVWSGIFAGPSIEGPLSVNAQVPFRTNIHWATKDVKFMPGAFSVILDLTKMAVSSEGKLDKPSGIPLRLELQGAGNANGVKLDSFRAQFHTLKLSGSGELPYPLGQKFLAAFRLDLESLAQFPQLLPMLRQAEGKGASLADAQGAIHAEGSVRLSLDQPSRSMVNFKTFVVRGLRLPLAYAGESLSAKGVLLGNAHIQGKFDAGDLSLADSTGSFDLSALAEE